MHIWVHACVHIHIHLTSQRGPPVRLGAPVPLWFLAYGIMLGRYFCLLGWLLDMVFIWIGNLFSFESIYSTEKRSGRIGAGVGWGVVAIRSMHRSALTRRTWVNIGHLEETDVLKCLLSFGCFQSWQFVFQMYTLFLGGSQRDGVVFSRSRTHKLSSLMANLCQSEIRVKWPGKSEYSHPFGWHLGDCNHSVHWYALYYVLITCFQWHSPALAPLL